MAIQISHVDEQDLRWYFSRAYEADMGSRSTMGGILDAIERGVSIRFDKEGGISERAVRACREYRRIRDATLRCSVTETAVLHATFGRLPPAHVKGEAKTVWHELVGPLLRTSPSLVPSIARLYSKSMDRSKSSQSAWLEGIAKGKSRVAQDLIAVIRSEAEQLVLAAVATYRGEGKEVGRTFGLRELGRILGKHHETVSAELMRHKVPVRGRRGPRGISFRVRVADLEKYAPDLANDVKRSVSGEAV